MQAWAAGKEQLVRQDTAACRPCHLQLPFAEGPNCWTHKQGAALVAEPQRQCHSQACRQRSTAQRRPWQTSRRGRQPRNPPAAHVDAQNGLRCSSPCTSACAILSVSWLLRRTVLAYAMLTTWPGLMPARCSASAVSTTAAISCWRVTVGPPPVTIRAGV